MNEIEIGTKNVDVIASILKSVAGVVPYAGNALSELVSYIIPNQRVDRIEKYIKVLAAKISEIDEQKLSSALQNEECIDLFEESFLHAARAISDERRSYISEIIKNGISDEEIEYSESKYVMKMIQELNDQELIWLRYFLNPTIGSDKEFYAKHRNILEPIRAYIGSDAKTIEKAEVQKSYKEHLERMGLLNSNINLDSKTKLPEFDTFTGKPKSSYTYITPVGKMILRHIGMLDI